jgi:hypothetical protein
MWQLARFRFDVLENTWNRNVFALMTALETTWFGKEMT